MKTIGNVCLIAFVFAGCMAGGDDVIVSGELRVKRADLNRCMALGGTRQECRACLSRGLTPEECVAPPETCGNGSCAATESCESCSADCGVCPDPGNQPPVVSLPATKTINRGELLSFDLLGSYRDSADPNIVDMSGTHDSDGQIQSVCFEPDANFMAQATSLGITMYCAEHPSREFGDNGWAHALAHIATREVPLGYDLEPSIAAGQYAITVAVTDDQGAVSRASLALTIEEPSGDHPPVFSLPQQVTISQGDFLSVAFSPYMVQYFRGAGDRGVIDLSAAYDPDGQLHGVTCGYWGTHGGGSAGSIVMQDYGDGCNAYNLDPGSYGLYVILRDPTGNETRVESELVVQPSS